MSYPPGRPEEDGSTSAANLGPRLLAKLVDFVILWVVYAIVVFPFFVDPMLDVSALDVGFSASAFVAGLISFALYLAYFIVLEMTTGQTLGKKVLKLRVYGPAGGYPTFEQALRRNGWMILGIVPVLGTLAVLAAGVFILVTISNNTATRQGWHDEFAGGTYVVRQS
ncbi:MAG TPA: RDD family protein [Jiangellaceae bacterium]